jgi:hypothetical protein
MGRSDFQQRRFDDTNQKHERAKTSSSLKLRAARARVEHELVGAARNIAKSPVDVKAKSLDRKANIVS